MEVFSGRPRSPERHPPGGRPRERRASLLNLRSAAGQVFLLQVVIVVLLVVAAVVGMMLQAARDALQQGRRESVIAAQSFASAPGTAAALRSRDPSAVLQPRTEVARKRAGVDFIVVMSTTGIRYTYPYPREIGKKFVGTIEPALKGRTVVEQAGGPPLPAGKGTDVQAVVPVTDSRGKVVGLVSAGLTVRNVAALDHPAAVARPRWRWPRRERRWCPGGSGGTRTACPRWIWRGCTSTTTRSCTRCGRAC